jgi:hypothetical protein
MRGKKNWDEKGRKEKRRESVGDRKYGVHDSVSNPMHSGGIE